MNLMALPALKPNRADVLLTVLDLTGTFVFAVEGALAAVRGNLDFFGLMVLSFATVLGGGVVRDLLIGAAPPQSLRDWRYAVTAFLGGASVFFFHRFVLEFPASALVGTMLACRYSLSQMEKRNYKMSPFIAVCRDRHWRWWWMVATFSPQVPMILRPYLCDRGLGRIDHYGRRLQTGSHTCPSRIPRLRYLLSAACRQRLAALESPKGSGIVTTR
jgi:hypothetical protein